jgi:hypothetical protein
VNDSQPLAALIPRGAPQPETRLHRALTSARVPDLAFKPMPWPSKPARLAMCGGGELDALARRVREGERQGADNGSEYQGMQDWMLDRASVRAANESRLRSLLWTIETLDVVGDDDRSASSFARLMRDYLRDVWQLEEVPRGVEAREAYVHRVIGHRHRQAMR